MSKTLIFGSTTGKQGVYGGLADWKDHAGRFQAIGDETFDVRVMCDQGPTVYVQEAVGQTNEFIIPMVKTDFDGFAATDGSSREQIERYWH